MRKATFMKAKGMEPNLEYSSNYGDCPMAQPATENPQYTEDYNIQMIIFQREIILKFFL